MLLRMLGECCILLDACLLAHHAEVDRSGGPAQKGMGRWLWWSVVVVMVMVDAVWADSKATLGYFKRIYIRRQ